MLKFDADTINLLKASYLGADITRRRLENMTALAPAPGEVILDLGCGPGLIAEELQRAVGPKGRVIAVDPSPDMRADAAARCADLPNVAIVDGQAGALPLPENSLDAAISLQVFEYLPNIPAALTDLHAKLRPGGRLVIGDMQWNTFSWASEDPERMIRMQRAWEGHVAEPNVPELLPRALASSGFQLIELRPVPFSAITLRTDSLSFMMLHAMRNYVVQNDLVSEQEAKDWFDEQVQRAEDGRFFFSLTHFVAIAIRI